MAAKIITFEQRKPITASKMSGLIMPHVEIGTGGQVANKVSQISQRDIVGLHLLDNRVKQIRESLKQAIADRDVRRKAVLDAMVNGATVEDGPHEAFVKRTVKLDIA